MNKDLRLGRKGAPTGFGHGRRHSCLGYVLKLCILRLCGAHIHERECSNKLQKMLLLLTPGLLMSFTECDTAEGCF